jgi:hypothetical protein
MALDLCSTSSRFLKALDKTTCCPLSDHDGRDQKMVVIASTLSSQNICVFSNLHTCVNNVRVHIGIAKRRPIRSVVAGEFAEAIN